MNQPRTGQFPVASAIARIPARGMFSTGLPSTQPAARPSQAPAIRSGRSSCLLPPGRIRGGQDLVEAAGLRRAQRTRQLVELVEQLERERAQLRRDRLLGGAAARCGRSAGGEPALLDVVDVLPFLARLPELVPDQILRLDPRDSQAGHLTGRERRERLRPLLVPLRVAREDLRRDDGHRPARLLDVDLARR